MAWDRLPPLVLVHIFEHLRGRDRVAASEVCTSWRSGFFEPSLWRFMKVYIDRDLKQDPHPELNTVNEALAVHLVKMFAKDLRRLELALCRPSSHPLEQYLPEEQAEAGSSFLRLLLVKQVQLKELKLTNWLYMPKCHHRKIILSALADFLSSQQKLKIFSLQNARLGSREAMRLLAAVARSCVLDQLNLCGAFRDWWCIYNNTKYVDTLRRLNGLTNIRLDYSSLNDTVLAVFSQQAVLQFLHIAVKRSDRNYYRELSDDSWNLLSTSCPRLKVSFVIVNIPYYEELCRFLQPSIPLSNFHLLSGIIWNQSVSRDFRSTISLLIHQYKDTLACRDKFKYLSMGLYNLLENVQLKLRNNREMLDDLILQLLKECRHLSHFQYDGVLHNINTVREIYLMKINTQTNVICRELVKREIAKEYITMKVRLIEKLIQVWCYNPRIQEVIQSCNGSMPRRIEAVIKTRGGPTKY